MAYSRGYQPQQQLQQSPSPWASGAPPYLHQQHQQIPQHHAVMQPQHQLQGGYGPPDFPAPGPYGQPGNYSAPMSYGRSPTYVPMSRAGSFAMQQQQPHRQPVQSGNRNNFGVANKRPGQGFDNSSLVKRNRPVNGAHLVANNNSNNRNAGGNRANNVQNQSKNLNANNNNNRNVQANGTNQQNNSNNNKNRNQQNKVQNQQNKQQNQPNKQQNQQNKQKANEAQSEIAKHIAPFNGFVCKLCTVYMKDKAARTEHLKDDSHKIRVAEFDAAAKKTETAVTSAAVPAATTDAAAPAVDPVPVVPAAVPADTEAVADAPVENKSQVKEAVPTTTPVTPDSAAAAEKTCACNHSTA